MKNIIYIYPKSSTFIESDIRILSKLGSITRFTGDWSNKLMLPFLFLKQFIFLLFKLSSTDVVIVSFGGYWSLLPSVLGRFFRTPVYIILHGTDCCGFANLHYGNLRKKYLKKVIGLSYRYATKLLPVSSSLIYTENLYYSDKVIKQGFQYHFPELKTSCDVVPNVFDSEEWFICKTTERKQNRFVSVMGQAQFTLKGGDLILKLADEFPKDEFYLVGLEAPISLQYIPDNLFFLGRKSTVELCEIFNTATYYLQLSISEGFGCALCEAMLSGCIPIVSSVNILPEIVGDSGYVLEKRNLKLLLKLLTKVKGTNDKTPQNARQQILNKFPISKREDYFKKII